VTAPKLDANGAPTNAPVRELLVLSILATRHNAWQRDAHTTHHLRFALTSLLRCSKPKNERALKDWEKHSAYWSWGSHAPKHWAMHWEQRSTTMLDHCLDKK
jgi:hypothetical protein